GRDSDTNFSPSRLVWRIVACVLSGSARLFGSLIRTFATYPSSQTFSTVPTVTSSTFTVDFGTRSRTSANSTVTVYDGPLIFAPPGNGSEYTLKSQPVSRVASASTPATIDVRRWILGRFT